MLRRIDTNINIKSRSCWREKGACCWIRQLPVLQQAGIHASYFDVNTGVDSPVRLIFAFTVQDMQTLAYRLILSQLSSMGLLTGSVDDMLDADIGAIFMPHGLGHMLGLDTHDVGGYLPGTPPRIQRPGYNRMRTARVVRVLLFLFSCFSFLFF